MADETGSARQEAERLVATVLAMASGTGRRPDDTIGGTSARIVDGLGTLGGTLAGFVGQVVGERGSQRTPGEDRSSTAPAEPGEPAVSEATGAATPDEPARHGWSTGSAECCVCPVCRAIAGLRDPSPQSAARLAAGAGDFATGVASLMRAVSAVSGSRPRPARPSRPAPAPPEPDVAWSAATRAAGPHETPGQPNDQMPAGDDSPWSAATRASAREEHARAAEQRVRAAEERARVAAEQRVRAAQERSRAAAEAVADTQARGAADRPGTATAGSTTGSAGRGRDVWAAATAQSGSTPASNAALKAGSASPGAPAPEGAEPTERIGDGGVAAAPSVDHDETGDEARADGT